MVIQEIPIHPCAPRNVQKFIQSGAAIAGQIETDFFKTPNNFDIWPLPREAGEWVQVHSMNQAESRLHNILSQYTSMYPYPDRCVP